MLGFVLGMMRCRKRLCAKTVSENLPGTKSKRGSNHQGPPARVHRALRRAPNRGLSQLGRKINMDPKTHSFITTRPLAPTPEQLTEAAADLYDACKFALYPNRSGYSLFSTRATVVLEAAVAKAECRCSTVREQASAIQKVS